VRRVGIETNGDCSGNVTSPLRKLRLEIEHAPRRWVFERIVEAKAVLIRPTADVETLESVSDPVTEGFNDGLFAGPRLVEDVFGRRGSLECVPFDDREANPGELEEVGSGWHGPQPVTPRLHVDPYPPSKDTAV